MREENDVHKKIFLICVYERPLIKREFASVSQQQEPAIQRRIYEEASAEIANSPVFISSLISAHEIM